MDMDQDIPEALQQEVDGLIAKVVAFQGLHGRRVARAFKRTRKGRPLLEELGQFGLPLPPDFRAMYHNHNGADPGATMSWHQMAVFLDWQWPDLWSVISVNKVSRKRKEFPSPDRIWMTREETRFTSLELYPAGEVEGQVPLLATQGPLSAVTYVAFDSPLLMLRTVVAAQEAGLISYDTEGRAAYPLQDMAALAGAINPRQTYWTALAEGTVDFKIPRKTEEEL